eukprot:jgi/Hompol1/5059/HPOL_004126-RA
MALVAPLILCSPDSTAAAAAAAAAAPAASALNLRGINPDTYSLHINSHIELHLYRRSSSTFTCLDGNGIIPIAAVNDDFCDCADGSDEPGTSACPNGSFFCLNAGHIGAALSSSRVNDGVCDPECCDGSDEYSGLRTCPNTCATVAIEHAKATKESQTKLREGIKRKQRLIKFAVSNKQTRAKELIKLKKTVDELNENIQALTSVLSMSASCRRGLALTGKLPPLCRSEIKSDAESIEAAKKAAADLDYANSCPAKLQDAKTAYLKLQTTAQNILRKHDIVAGAVDALEALSETCKQEPLIVALNQALDVNDVDEHETATVNSLISDDAYLAADSRHDAAPTTTDNEEDDDIDPCIDNDASLGKCLSSSIHNVIDFVKTGLTGPILWPGWSKMVRSVVGYKSATTTVDLNANKARARLNEAQDKLRDAENRIAVLNDMETRDFGPDREWEQYLETNQCFTFKDIEYTYEVCMFKQITQISKSGGSVSLGSFSRWGDRSSTDKKYDSMMYENGMQCWNGPQRSAELKMSCGTATQIQSVTETNRCEYLIVAESPAVCPTESS